MLPVAMGALFALQCFHVLFLALHDWILWEPSIT